jgi:hypothetical protein
MDEQMSRVRPDTESAPARWASVTVAVDAQVPHDEALRWIARHTVDGIEHVRIVGVDPPVNEAPDTTARTDDALVEAVRAACPGVTVSLARRPGPVTDAIVDESGGDDLLVVGAYRSRRGATAGRNPARIAERAFVPTVVVPDVPHPIDGDVVLAVDEPLDPGAEAIAVAEALRRRRRLTLLRAWEMPVLTRTGLTDFAEDPLRWRRVNAELLERATAQLRARHPELRIHPLLVEGHPGRAIADHTRLASLVVLGQGHVHVLSGSVLHDLLRETSSPVCVVPPAAASAAVDEPEEATA